MDYPTFKKHAKKVIKDLPEKRKNVQGILHTGTGDVIVTDSHRLYKLSGISDVDKRQVWSETDKVLDLQYPDVSRLIPDLDQASGLALMTSKNFKRGVRSLTGFSEVADSHIVTFRNGSLSVYDKEGQHAGFESDDLTEAIEISMDIRYLYQALELFDAFKVGEIEIRYFGQMRPFVLISPDQSIIALLMPVRRY